MICAPSKCLSSAIMPPYPYYSSPGGSFIPNDPEDTELVANSSPPWPLSIRSSQSPFNDLAGGSPPFAFSSPGVQSLANPLFCPLAPFSPTSFGNLDSTLSEGFIARQSNHTLDILRDYRSPTRATQGM